MFGTVPDYIENKEDAARNFYPDEYLRNREIITSLIEVGWGIISWFRLIFCKDQDQYYNAFDKDIAILHA